MAAHLGKITERERCIRKLGELISGIDVAMLTTLGSDGAFHSRPMWTQKRDFDGQLWFFTHSRSPKAMELKNDDHVSLTYCDSDDHRFVAVTGRAQVVADGAEAQRLWHPTYETWFPRGLSDPDLALVRIKVEHAEYWDLPLGKVVQLVGFRPRIRLAG